MKNVLKIILNSLKQILLSGAMVTADLIPGSDLVIHGAEKLFDNDKSNNMEGILQINEGAITALEAIKGNDIVDEVLLNEGISDMKAAFDKIRKAVKK
jgi:hypothetical protein